MAEDEDRLLILDESLPKRLRPELDRRGRAVAGLGELELLHLKDPPLLDWIAEHRPECVLVTGDDNMPNEHGAQIRALGLTVATVDPRIPDGVHPDAWKRDTVHRWAHAMQGQGAGTIRRYSPTANRLWRPLRR